MRATSVEICAGAGGTAVGLHAAGFDPAVLVEIDKHACRTLRHNMPMWQVVEADVCEFDGRPYEGIDLLSGGVPCPPFSVAGQRLGANDDRDLFPEMLRLAAEMRPKAVLIENVPGLMTSAFDHYRAALDRSFEKLGYMTFWETFNSSDFGVSQLRPRVALVALRHALAESFSWPESIEHDPPTVGELLLDEMASGGWSGAHDWAAQADRIAPTLVGGSKKHGGPDLGPTRAKKAWAELGVNGHTLADEPPGPDHEGMPRLTVRMAALVQGFPQDWEIVGRKTNAYRQVGNAFPPPVAEAIGSSIISALTQSDELVTTRTMSA